MIMPCNYAHIVRIINIETHYYFSSFQILVQNKFNINFDNTTTFVKDSKNFNHRLINLFTITVVHIFSMMIYVITTQFNYQLLVICS